MGKLFRTNWRLKPSILTSFILLTVPVFFSMIAVTYYSNDRIARENAQAVIERFRTDAIASIQDDFEAIKSLARSAAAVGAASPGFYEGEDAYPYFLSLLQHSPRIVSAYVGLPDGRFLQTRRIDPGVAIQEAPPPDGARYAYRSVLPTGDGGVVDRYRFIDDGLTTMGTREGATDYDPRGRLWYETAAAAGGPTISDPDMFAALGLIGFTVAAPYDVGGALGGVTAIDLTLEGLGAYLADRKVSSGTLSYVLDRRGRVIAAASDARTYVIEDGRLELLHVASLENPLPAVAYGYRPRGNATPADSADAFYFNHDGADFVASLTALPPEFGKQWQIFTITPMVDFTGPFHVNNERLVVIGLIAMAAQILFVYLLTGMLTAPLEKLAVKVGRIQELGTETLASVRSSIREIAVLSTAVDTLDAAVKSFAAFVPVGLVSQLVESEQKLELGGHNRFLTIFFSDLESFSTLSEELPSRELMLRVSAYFELTTRAVNETFGTIDKFIGDGVMAFWGAPALLDEHAWHACVAAVRIQRGMNALNAGWTADGLKPLNVRIGIHSDAVLVGNIGSKARMSYTVMGDGVNVAARLEGVNKEFGTRICVSHTVFKEAGDRLCVRPIEDVAVKGRRSLIPIYEVLGAYETGDASLEPDAAAEALAERTRDAYRARQAGDVETARRLYQAILTDYPGDPVATAILARMEAA